MVLAIDVKALEPGRSLYTSRYRDEERLLFCRPCSFNFYLLSGSELFSFPFPPRPPPPSLPHQVQDVRTVKISATTHNHKE